MKKHPYLRTPEHIILSNSALRTENTPSSLLRITKYTQLRTPHLFCNSALNMKTHLQLQIPHHKTPQFRTPQSPYPSPNPKAYPSLKSTRRLPQFILFN